MKRNPAVAGHFYSSSPSALTDQVKEYVQTGGEKRRAIGVVSPHAGLIYSGAVAGAVFSHIRFPRTFLLIGPNHTGMGSSLSLMSSGEWVMPTGQLRVDSQLAHKLLESSDLIQEDTIAHSMEHSLEVQLPFILYFSSDVMIVPVTIMSDALEVCRALGEAVAGAVQASPYDVTIVASSDMTHYENDASARMKDERAIQKILQLDAEGLFEIVRKEKISMCGIIPVTVMLFAAQKLGASKSTLVKYMTSGDVSGDYDYVVGYAGIIIE